MRGLYAVATASSMTSAQLPVPEARYARSGDFSIIYQVMGEGPIEAYVCRSATDTFDGDARGLPRLRPTVNRRSRVREQQPCAARSGMAGSGCQRCTAG